jgi:hypothetical protein
MTDCYLDVITPQHFSTPPHATLRMPAVHWPVLPAAALSAAPDPVALIYVTIIPA